MDDSILQILKANQTAKNKVKETLASHADDIQKLQEKKADIDVEMERLFEQSKHALEQELMMCKEDIHSKIEDETRNKLIDLETRFEASEAKWFQTLLEGITNPHGK